MKIVGVGAHPDDIEIYFLGLLLIYQAQGHAIEWVVASNGEAGSNHLHECDPGQGLAAIRQSECQAAARRFGVDPIFLNLPDGGLDSAAQAGEVIGRALDRLSPDIVITHSPNDYHPDHRALSRLVTRRRPGKSHILWADTLSGRDFEPAIFADITKLIAAKCDAIRIHVSQRPDRYLANVRHLNSARAAQCGLPRSGFAEAFRWAENHCDESRFLPHGYLQARRPKIRVGE